MKHDENYESSDVEDRRGESSGGRGFGGGGGLRLPTGRFGLGGLVVLIVLSVVFKTDLVSGVLGSGDGGALAPTEQAPAYEPAAGGTRAIGGAVTESASEKASRHLAAFVLDDAQQVWAKVFEQSGQPYSKAKLVLFRGGVRSGCGDAESAMGPFYCPADRRVYIDLGFYDELARRFKAPGDFAQAYVLTHEIGHHIQNLLGTEQKLRRMQASDPSQKNALSVAMELQADCYAGVWAATTEQRKLLESGDVDEALGAASAVGDDRLQRQATGGVHPESFTHGSSAQRASWFKRGMANGDMRACDTFGGASR